LIIKRQTAQAPSTSSNATVFLLRCFDENTINAEATATMAIAGLTPVELTVSRHA